jgi:hypothetical protein
MQHFARLFGARVAILLAALVSSAALVQADNEPMIVTGVFCDTQQQVEGFAEAHLGAQLSVREATRAINKAAGKDDACSPISNVIVGNMEEVKDLKIAGKGYAVTRLRVVGILQLTPAGMVARSVPALEQYVLAKGKGEDI